MTETAKKNKLSVNVEQMKKPALIGGVLSGVLSVVPLVNLLNICLLLPILGGVVAAAQLKKLFPKILAIDGAAVGALMGVVSGLIATVGNAVLTVAFSMVAGFDTTTFAIGIVTGLVANLILHPLGGAIGGLIYTLASEKKPAASKASS